MTKREKNESEQGQEREALLKILAISEVEIAAAQTYPLEQVIAELRKERLEHDRFLLP